MNGHAHCGHHFVKNVFVCRGSRHLVEALRLAYRQLWESLICLCYAPIVQQVQLRLIGKRLRCSVECVICTLNFISMRYSRVVHC